MSSALFRLIGGMARNMIVANTFGSFALLIVMVLGGFILSRGRATRYLVHKVSKIQNRGSYILIGIMHVDPCLHANIYAHRC